MLVAAQIVISIILIVLVIIQERGAGLGAIFGGEAGTPYHARRGLERLVFGATFISAAILVILAILNLIVT